VWPGPNVVIRNYVNGLSSNTKPLNVEALFVEPHLIPAAIKRAVKNWDRNLELGLNVQGTSRLNVEVLQNELVTQLFGVGDRLIYLPVVDSTNTFTMQLAQERPEEGVVVLTDSQTAGKGRLGRHWVDVSGCNVLSSILLRPLFPPHLLVMLASLAVVDTIVETCNVSATIKWPNDVLIADRKVAGILIETSQNPKGKMIAILGIGVNVNGHIQDLSERFPNQASLVARATTLEAVCGHPVSREAFIAHLLKHVETDYFALQREASETSSVVVPAQRPVSRLIRERWRGHLSTLGRTISVQQKDAVVSGVAEDVDDNGELLLRGHSGERVSITWGDVNYPTR
jgi:BirA family biotin operon repressor/biotin-[acetyl-CoA-carboxylase] ligase